MRHNRKRRKAQVSTRDYSRSPSARMTESSTNGFIAQGAGGFHDYADAPPPVNTWLTA